MIGGTAHVELAVLRRRVVLEVLVVEHVVDEAGVAVPVVVRQGVGQRHMPLEILGSPRELVEVLDKNISRFERAPYQKLILALGLEPLELVEDVAAHRRHAGAAADEDHFLVGVAREELAERAGDRDLVARLQVEDVGRHLARPECLRCPAAARRPDVEHDDALFVRVVRHRVGALDRLGTTDSYCQRLKLVPVLAVLLVDVEVLIGKAVCGRLDLDVAAGAEIHVLALRQFQDQRLDEGGDVVVGATCTPTS
jgi:hypothetical protein